MRTVLACLFLGFVASFADAAPVKFNDPKPQAYHLTVRASEVDPSAKSYPDIEFGLESKGRNEVEEVKDKMVHFLSQECLQRLERQSDAKG